MLEELRKVMRDAALGKGSGEALPVELHPSMLAALARKEIPADGVRFGFEEECVKMRSAFQDRTKIVLIAKDSSEFVVWEVPSIRALFRGSDKVSPDVMQEPPPEYNVFFQKIERHVVDFGAAGYTPFDEEFIEVYSTMRRRPDGKSLGFVHDIVWQAAAFELGLRPWSEDEYTAVFNRLTKSAKTFKIGKGSRNYITSIRPVYEK